MLIICPQNHRIEGAPMKTASQVTPVKSSEKSLGKSVQNPSLKTLELTREQNDFDKRGALKSFTKNPLALLAQGSDCDGAEFVDGLVFNEGEKTEALVRDYADNAVFFARVAEWDDPQDKRGYHYVDVVLNVVKHNKLTSTLSGKTFKDAQAIDYDGDAERLPMVMFIKTDKLSPEQMQMVLA